MHTCTLSTVLTLLPLALSAPFRPTIYHPRALYLRQDNNTSIPESSAPACDLSTLTQPASTLQAPSPDMRLVLIALGEGTQNYTCASSTSNPSAIGAMANLYDASCALSSNPTLSTSSLSASAPSIGTHFFVDTTTPDFDIASLGNTRAKKVEDANAPNPGSDVKWLRLAAQAEGSSSQVKEIYRLSTEGGLAPATCEGREVGEVVTVGYRAQYWIYA